MKILDIIPILAVILTNFIGFSILISYYYNRTNLIKKYNYLLFYILFCNALCWFIYAILTKDIYVLTSTFVPVFGCFMFIQVLHKDIPQKYLFFIELLCSLLFIYFMCLTILLNFIKNHLYISIIKQIHYIVSMVMSISTNIAPILILVEVCKTSNSELIYLPQAIIGFINISLWLIYSFLISDIYQITANTVNIIMSLIQLIVYLYYGCYKLIRSNNNWINLYDL